MVRCSLMLLKRAISKGPSLFLILSVSKGKMVQKLFSRAFLVESAFEKSHIQGNLTVSSFECF